MKFSVKLPNWADRLIESSESFRVQAKKVVLGWVARGGFKDRPTKEGQRLVDELENKDEFTFIGFVPWLHYIREKAGDGASLNAIYEHKLGTETLVYASKKHPFLIVVNPGLRHNQTILNELRDSRVESEKHDLSGVTG